MPTFRHSVRPRPARHTETRPTRHRSVSLPLEDYGIIGDLHTAALVGRDGSIDWLCLPRFDSAACFSKLLGTEEHGYWKLAPAGSHRATHRRYRGDSLVLESEFVTEEGTVRVIDCMPIRQQHPEVVRLVEGVRGKVTMEMNLVIRYGYGQIVPWVRRLDGILTAIAGPDGLSLWTPVHTKGKDMSTVSRFTVSEGQQVPFSLAWFDASEEPPRPVDAAYAIEDTETWWRDWASQCTYQGPDKEAVVRSLITLKALTYLPTGGIVAAATSSLPETLGGERNWDYRFCWLRDATLTLESLMRGGFYQEATSHQGLKSERGIPQPAEAVVPVPLTTQRFGQRAGCGGDNPPGRLVGQRLESDEGAHHRLFVRALIGALGCPVAPPGLGVFDGVDRVDRAGRFFGGGKPRQ